MALELSIPTRPDPELHPKKFALPSLTLGRAQSSCNAIYVTNVTLPVAHNSPEIEFIDRIALSSPIALANP